VVHVEVTGKNGPALQKFYSEVFGWSLETNNPGGYGMLRQGELTGGIGATQDGSAGNVTLTSTARTRPRPSGRSRIGAAASSCR
jgi:predicted enzyme related to lactoylglutathione lyase